MSDIAADDFPEPMPINMILWCPNCGMQHVDSATAEWNNPPHRSHLCHGCHYIWRPADVPTNGVAEIHTQGRNDADRQRGRALCVLHEQRRITRIIEDANFAGPRLLSLRDNLLSRIRNRSNG